MRPSAPREALHGNAKAFDREPIRAASERLSAAIRRLEERTPEVVDSILHAMHALPEYAAVDDPVIWDEIRQHTTGSVRLSWSALRDGKLPSDREMTTALFFAQRRAEQGLVSLRALHSAYVTGMRILWEALIRETSGEPELRVELLDRSSWILEYLDFITSAVADAYHEAQKGRSRRHDQRTRDLFDEIIDGNPVDVVGLESRARLAGLDVGAEFRAVVIRGSSDAAGESAIGECRSSSRARTRRACRSSRSPRLVAAASCC